jgi:hypothetical protein
MRWWLMVQWLVGLSALLGVVLVPELAVFAHGMGHSLPLFGGPVPFEG